MKERLYTVFILISVNQSLRLVSFRAVIGFLLWFDSLKYEPVTSPTLPLKSCLLALPCVCIFMREVKVAVSTVEICHSILRGVSL